jgi:hypothetical protein
MSSTTPTTTTPTTTTSAITPVTPITPITPITPRHTVATPPRLGQPERVCDTIPVPHNLILSRLVHANLHSRSRSRSSTLRPPPSPSVYQPSSRAPMVTAAHQNDSQLHPMDIDIASTQSIPDPAQPNNASRKLCVRHQRMADEGTTNKMQQVSSFPPFSLEPLTAHRSPLSLVLVPRPYLLLTSRFSRASTPSHSPNAKPSTISGPLSPLPLIRAVSSSFAVSSPCAASPSFLSSPKSSAISSVSILSSSYPLR